MLKNKLFSTSEANAEEERFRKEYAEELKTLSHQWLINGRNIREGTINLHCLGCKKQIKVSPFSMFEPTEAYQLAKMQDKTYCSPCKIQK